MSSPLLQDSEECGFARGILNLSTPRATSTGRAASSGARTPTPGGDGGVLGGGVELSMSPMTALTTELASTDLNDGPVVVVTAALPSAASTSGGLPHAMPPISRMIKVQQSSIPSTPLDLGVPFPHGRKTSARGLYKGPADLFGGRSPLTNENVPNQSSSSLSSSSSSSGSGSASFGRRGGSPRSVSPLTQFSVSPTLVSGLGGIRGPVVAPVPSRYAPAPLRLSPPPGEHPFSSSSSGTGDELFICSSRSSSTEHCDSLDEELSAILGDDATAVAAAAVADNDRETFRRHMSMSEGMFLKRLSPHPLDAAETSGSAPDYPFPRNKIRVPSPRREDEDADDEVDDDDDDDDNHGFPARLARAQSMQQLDFVPAPTFSSVAPRSPPPPASAEEEFGLKLGRRRPSMVRLQELARPSPARAGRSQSFSSAMPVVGPRAHSEPLPNIWGSGGMVGLGSPIKGFSNRSIIREDDEDDDDDDEDDRRSSLTDDAKKKRDRAGMPAPDVNILRKSCHDLSSLMQSHAAVMDTTLRLPVVVNLKHDAINTISCLTMRDILNGKYSHSFSQVFILDCRFDYEFEGGHIKGAIHANDPQVLVETFFRPPLDSSICVIFHCEFSSKRGPAQYSLMRELDRKANQADYPRLYYPQIYLMEGGYCEFFQQCPKLCEPQAYIEMNDERFKHRLKGNFALVPRKGLKKKRRSICDELLSGDQ